MADTVLNTLESSSSPLSSILSKLPGKRIDARIRENAAGGIPDQGELTGGYWKDYTHLSHMPLLPLHSDAQLELMAKEYYKNNDAQQWDRLKEYGNQPIPLGVQLAFKGMDLAGGGFGSLSTIQWVGRTIALASTSAGKWSVDQDKVAVFTRWAIHLTNQPPGFVDVLEFHWTDPNSKRAKMAKTGGNAILLKAGLPERQSISFKVLECEVTNLKDQKLWSKRWGVKQLCESISSVHDGKEVPMAIVAKIQRNCSIVEREEIEKRFTKHWRVPVL